VPTSSNFREGRTAHDLSGPLWINVSGEKP
jgi:hypothetical protein